MDNIDKDGQPTDEKPVKQCRLLSKNIHKLNFPSEIQVQALPQQ